MMRRKTMRDRRARVGLESLEGRELLAAGTGPWSGLAAVEHQILIAARHQGQFHATLAEVRLFNHHLLHASKGVPGPVNHAITFGPAVVDEGSGAVTITGFAYPRALVRLRSLPGGTIERIARADASGRFQLTIPFDSASTPMSVVATLPGRRAAATIVIPKQLPASAAPVTPPIPVDVPPVTTQVPAIGPSGAANNSSQASYAALNDLLNAKLAIDNTLLPDYSGGEWVDLWGF